MSDFQPNLAHILELNAFYWADRPAYICDGKTLTYGALYYRGRKLAAALYQHGLLAQDRVAVLSQNSIEYGEIYAACELSRLITATINFRLAPPEVAYIIKDSAAKVLIFEAEFSNSIDQIRSQLTSIEHFICIGDVVPAWATPYEHFLGLGDENASLPKPGPRDIAYLIYTSGTTGKPKGCMLGHEANVRQAESCNVALRAEPSDRILLMMPMFHIGAKAFQLSLHQRAATVYLHRNFDVEAILRSIQNDKITITHMAPTMIQTMLDHPRIRDFDVSSLRLLGYSAAAMPVELLRRAISLFGSIFMNSYGQTEGAGTYLPACEHLPNGSEKERRRLASVGVPFPNVRIMIADEQGKECPPEIPGEILIQGPVMMLGYWNNSTATIETLRNGWLHTGDIGKKDEDGFIYLVDRKKDVIISGGENIYSREVEEAIYQHAAVAEVAVIGIADEKWGEAVCAIVQLKSGQSLDEDSLIQHCRAQIASYKRPRRVIFIENMPKLASGKIAKAELRAQYNK